MISLGLSPRGRGNHPGPIRQRWNSRSIPAWAGEPVTWVSSGISFMVYPRVGGGTGHMSDKNNTAAGLSPRGRGNPLIVIAAIAKIGSIPAWAGEPSPGRFRFIADTVYPRVGGGTICGYGGLFQVAGLSPRGRGNPDLPWGSTTTQRSIPAWAGEPGGVVSTCGLHQVYPRVGGGTSTSTFLRCAQAGLSPRGRGNLTMLLYLYFSSGSIPAWAGEPYAE